MSLHCPSEAQLAAAVADNVVYDWRDVESRCTSPQERTLVQQFFTLAQIAARVDEPAVGDVWGSLTLIRLVGEGSYGSVYLARDRQLDRDVAVKLFRRLDFSPAGLERAIDEGRLLARVRHPNVLTVYGADQHGRRFGLWTEFVSGQTLKQVVASGPLSAQEAALVGLELCRALAAVHRAGLVHGDVKAQNVMREAGGRVVLMDFGAGAVMQSAMSDGLVGTPAYLAPELLDGGRPSVASDLYALGVLLFYLTTGTFPIQATSLEDLSAAHLTQRRQRLLDLRPDAPAWLAELVDLATAPNPADRPESAGAFEREILQRIGAVPRGAARVVVPSWAWLTAAVASVAVAAVLVWAEMAGAPSAVSGRTAIAVKTVVTTTADGEAADVAADFHQGLVIQLRDSPSLRLLEAETPGGSSVDLETQVRRDRDGLVLNATALEPESRAELWHETFVDDRTGGVRLAEAASRGIGVALRTRFSSEWPRVLKSTGGNVEAAGWYVGGLSHLSARRSLDLLRARTLFEQAIAAVPTFALAEAGLAEAITLIGVRGDLPLADALSRADALAASAVAHDDSLAEGHAILGYVRKLQLSFVAAEASLSRAVALRPNYTDARIRLSTVLMQQGKSQAALAELRTASALEPSSIPAQTQLIVALYFDRHFADARDAARSFLQNNPNDVTIAEVLGLALMELREYAGARAAFETALRSRMPGSADGQLQSDIAVLDARMGRRRDAEQILRTLEQSYLSQRGEVDPTSIAAVFAALGDPDAAFKWLEVARAANDPGLGYLLVEPRWDPLIGDSRFAELLKRVRPQ